MSLTDENPTPQQPAPEPIQEPIQLPPLRRRRRRYLIAPGEDERAVMLENLARRAFPSLEFFIFSLLCGAVLGAGYILGAQSILLLGALISPLMTPWVGLTLASISGNIVQVDVDGAGHGWFVDVTPEEDAEFGIESGGELTAAQPITPIALLTDADGPFRFRQAP